jgi:hypothetical protein
LDGIPASSVPPLTGVPPLEPLPDDPELPPQAPASATTDKAAKSFNGGCENALIPGRRVYSSGGPERNDGRAQNTRAL